MNIHVSAAHRCLSLKLVLKALHMLSDLRLGLIHKLFQLMYAFLFAVDR